MLWKGNTVLFSLGIENGNKNKLFPKNPKNPKKCQAIEIASCLVTNYGYVGRLFWLVYDQSIVVDMCVCSFVVRALRANKRLLATIIIMIMADQQHFAQISTV